MWSGYHPGEVVAPKLSASADEKFDPEQGRTNLRFAIKYSLFIITLRHVILVVGVTTESAVCRTKTDVDTWKAPAAQGAKPLRPRPTPRATAMRFIHREKLWPRTESWRQTLDTKPTRSCGRRRNGHSISRSRSTLETDFLIRSVEKLLPN